APEAEGRRGGRPSRAQDAAPLHEAEHQAPEEAGRSGAPPAQAGEDGRGSAQGLSLAPVLATTLVYGMAPVTPRGGRRDGVREGWASRRRRRWCWRVEPVLPGSAGRAPG